MKLVSDERFSSPFRSQYTTSGTHPLKFAVQVFTDGTCSSHFISHQRGHIRYGIRTRVESVELIPDNAKQSENNFTHLEIGKEAGVVSMFRVSIVIVHVFPCLCNKSFFFSPPFFRKIKEPKRRFVWGKSLLFVLGRTMDCNICYGPLILREVQDENKVGRETARYELLTREQFREGFGVASRHSTT